MIQPARTSLLWTLLAALVLAVSTWNVANVVAADQAPENALAAYVAKPDDSYGWKKHDEGTLDKASYVELILTSQTWRDIPWKHQLCVMKPSNVKAGAKHGLLIIAGGECLRIPSRSPQPTFRNAISRTMHPTSCSISHC